MSTDIDPALAAKHRAMWALGDYPAVATDLVAVEGTPVSGSPPNSGGTPA